MEKFKALVWANFGSCLAFVLLVLLISYESPLVMLDTQLNLSMKGVENSFLISFFNAISFIFDIKSIAIISLVLSIWLWIKSSKKEGVFFMVVIAIGGIFLYLLKDLIQRARPLNPLVSETSFAFPSGHAMTSVIFFGLLIYLLSKKTKSTKLNLAAIALSLIFVIIISFARLYLRVHWFSDVLGGIAIGIFVLTGSILIREKLEK